ncbi:hypothetical protein OSTOST_08456 [Ostertagia ostertagi]
MALQPSENVGPAIQRHSKHWATHMRYCPTKRNENNTIRMVPLITETTILTLPCYNFFADCNPCPGPACPANGWRSSVFSTSFKIEAQVEDEYIQGLRMNCYKEQNQRETLMYRARWQRDEDLLRRANQMPMPHCDRLKEIYSH